MGWGGMGLGLGLGIRIRMGREGMWKGEKGDGIGMSEIHYYEYSK